MKSKAIEHTIVYLIEAKNEGLFQEIKKNEDVITKEDENQTTIYKFKFNYVPENEVCYIENAEKGQIIMLILLTEKSLEEGENLVNQLRERSKNIPIVFIIFHKDQTDALSEEKKNTIEKKDINYFELIIGSPTKDFIEINKKLKTLAQIQRKKQCHKEISLSICPYCKIRVPLLTFFTENKSLCVKIVCECKNFEPSYEIWNQIKDTMHKYPINYHFCKKHPNLFGQKYCQSCRVWLCNFCCEGSDDMHKKWGINIEKQHEEHSLIPLQLEDKNLCLIHNDMSIESYRADFFGFVCPKCSDDVSAPSLMGKTETAMKEEEEEKKILNKQIEKRRKLALQYIQWMKDRREKLKDMRPIGVTEEELKPEKDTLTFQKEVLNTLLDIVNMFNNSLSSRVLNINLQENFYNLMEMITEISESPGWKAYPFVFSFNRFNNKAIFEEVKIKQIDESKKDMVRLQNDQIMINPNHRLVFKKNEGGDSKEDKDEIIDKIEQSDESSKIFLLKNGYYLEQTQNGFVNFNRITPKNYRKSKRKSKEKYNLNEGFKLEFIIKKYFFFPSTQIKDEKVVIYDRSEQITIITFNKDYLIKTENNVINIFQIKDFETFINEDFFVYKENENIYKIWDIKQNKKAVFEENYGFYEQRNEPFPSCVTKLEDHHIAFGTKNGEIHIWKCIINPNGKLKLELKTYKVIDKEIIYITYSIDRRIIIADNIYIKIFDRYSIKCLQCLEYNKKKTYKLKFISVQDVFMLVGVDEENKNFKLLKAQIYE